MFGTFDSFTSKKQNIAKYHSYDTGEVQMCTQQKHTAEQ